MENVLVIAVEPRDLVVLAEVLQAYGASEDLFLVSVQATVGICLELDLDQLGHVVRKESLSLLYGHLRRQTSRPLVLF